jgi:hypothetical protein
LWIEPEALNESPSGGLIFFHMRKAGGSQFLDIIHQWLKLRDCLRGPNRNDIHFSVVRGIEDGKFVTGPRHDIYCPYVSVNHQEFKCFDYNAMTALPKRNERSSTPGFHIFTILRDPIERIGSQAFYGRECVGTRVLEDTIYDMCVNSSNPWIKKDSIKPLTHHCKRKAKHIPAERCQCALAGLKKGIEILRTNETVWMDWIGRGLGFEDNYKTNYYVERLAGTKQQLNKQDNITRAEALKCFDNKDCRHVQADLLQAISPVFRCNIYSKLHSQSLQLAKDILENYIDFVILEKMSEKRSIEAIARVLHDNHSVISPLFDNFFNVGFITAGNKPANHTINGDKYSHEQHHSYRYIFPPNILKYLEKENAWDIELYNFAVDLFDRRTKEENLDEILQ